MKKLHEETFEFIEAVANYEDGKAHDYDYSTLVTMRDLMVDELGDMLLVLTQFIAKYEINKEELDLHMDYKLERLEDRIKNKYYDDKK